MNSVKMLLFVCLCSVVWFGSAFAESSFTNSVNVGLTVTDGNSDTMLGNIALESIGRLWCGSAIRMGLEGNYGESTVDGVDETTVENVGAYVQTRRDLSERWFVAVNASALYDDIAAIDYRVVLGPALGGYLVKQDHLALTTEVGPSYLWEDVADVEDDYFVLRVAERLEYTPNASTKVWQTAEYLPKAEDFDDYILKAEIGASAAMSARTHLRVALKVDYDSIPGAELEDTDVTLISGVGIQL
jgi:putative salt-induced outer membrane protein YdiY